LHQLARLLIAKSVARSKPALETVPVVTQEIENNHGNKSSWKPQLDASDGAFGRRTSAERQSHMAAKKEKFSIHPWFNDIGSGQRKLP
jgi:hypothetical protein